MGPITPTDAALRLDFHISPSEHTHNMLNATLHWPLRPGKALYPSGNITITYMRALLLGTCDEQRASIDIWLPSCGIP